MAFLTSSSVINIDAVLTKRGREIAATKGNINIRYFVPSDVGIDYTLINEDNEDPLGLLKEIPVLQAVPSGEIADESKLINLPYQSTLVPYIHIEDRNIRHRPDMAPVRIMPDTLNAGGNTAIEDEEYIAKLYNPNWAKIISYGDRTFNIKAQDSDDILGQASDYGLTTTVCVRGRAFEVMARSNIITSHTTMIKIEGTQSGDINYIKLTVTPVRQQFSQEEIAD